MKPQILSMLRFNCHPFLKKYDYSYSVAVIQRSIPNPMFMGNLGEENYVRCQIIEVDHIEKVL